MSTYASIPSVFKDRRLDERFNNICTNLASSLGQTVSEATQTWGATKAVYRFWDNPKVTPERIRTSHQEVIEKKLKDNGNINIVLQLSDSTEADFTGTRCSKFLGPLSFIKQRGLILHNSLLVSNTGSPIGVLSQSFTHRKDENFGKKRERIRNNPKTKESYRWLVHFNKGLLFCKKHPNLQLIYVADREGDNQLILSKSRPKNMNFIIRSNYDRMVSSSKSKLSTCIASEAAAGCYSVDVIHSKTRKLRNAHIECRFMPIDLAKTSSLKDNLHLFVVDVREINEDVEQSERIHWRILTSIPIISLADAIQIVDYYRLRWIIERFHFMLKTGGANIEKLQLGTKKRLENAIVTYSIAVMDAMSLRYWAQSQPDENAFNLGVTPLEWKVLYAYATKRINLKLQLEPESPPTISQYCVILGQITGFSPSKRQPIPGIKIITRSLEKLKTLVDAYQVFTQNTA